MAAASLAAATSAKLASRAAKAAAKAVVTASVTALDYSSKHPTSSVLPSLPVPAISSHPPSPLPSSLDDQGPGYNGAGTLTEGLTRAFHGVSPQLVSELCILAGEESVQP